MFRGCSLPTRPATSLSGFSFHGPAVAYEAILPNFSSFRRPNEGGNVGIRVLWAGAKMAREVGAVGTIHRAFMQLVMDTDLIDGRGRWVGGDVGEDVRRYGGEDVGHRSRCAMARGASR